jgi:hypothetical protein
MASDYPFDIFKLYLFSFKLFLQQMAELSEEAGNTNFIAYDLTRSGLEPTIYHTGGKHAIYYTTYAISTKVEEKISKGTTRLRKKQVMVPTQL